MSEMLPYKVVREMNELQLKNRREISSILVVDLKIPEEIHDLTNAFPLAP